MVSLTSASLTACDQTQDRIDDIGVAKAQLLATRKLPQLPIYCDEQEVVELRAGERLDSGLMKAYAAVNRANARTRHCSEWYSALREGFKDPENTNLTKTRGD